MAASFEFSVEHVEHQVRQERRKRSSLGYAFARGTGEAADHHASGEVTPDELDDCDVVHALSDETHENVVVDSVEELFEVDVDDDPLPPQGIALRLGDGTMRRTVRPEAVAVFGERSVP